MAPGDGLAEGALPIKEVAGATGEQLETSLQAGQECQELEQSRACHG